jgi:hypothetical protein
MLSIDAFIRTTLDDRDDSLHGSTPIGSTIGALGVGTVIESGDDRFQPGDAVAGGLGAQTHATVPTAFLEKVDTSRFGPATQLGAMGLTTGLTAYVGMKFVGRVTESDTVVVSGAAGGVGTFAGQIARLLGAKRRTWYRKVPARTRSAPDRRPPRQTARRRLRQRLTRPGARRVCGLAGPGGHPPVAGVVPQQQDRRVWSALKGSSHPLRGSRRGVC